MITRLAVVAWLTVVAAGFVAWEVVESTPGEAGPSADEPAQPGPSVVVYAHPHCPCTRAELPGLLDVLVAVPAGAVCEVVFVRPAGVPAGWERTRSWELAAGRPGVRVTVDEGGVRAAADGAAASGHAVAREASGRVAFRGGTSDRGPAPPADPAGLRAVAAVLASRTPEVPEAPTFGCPLATPAGPRGR